MACTFAVFVFTVSVINMQLNNDCILHFYVFIGSHLLSLGRHDVVWKLDLPATKSRAMNMFIEILLLSYLAHVFMNCLI